MEKQGHKGRPEKAPQPWSPKEMRLLRQYYPRHTAEWISWRLGRTIEAIDSKARRMGLYKSFKYMRDLRIGGKRA